MKAGRLRAARVPPDGAAEGWGHKDRPDARQVQGAALHASGPARPSRATVELKLDTERRPTLFPRADPHRVGNNVQAVRIGTGDDEGSHSHPAESHDPASRSLGAPTRGSRQNRGLGSPRSCTDWPPPTAWRAGRRGTSRRGPVGNGRGMEARQDASEIFRFIADVVASHPCTWRPTPNLSFRGSAARNPFAPTKPARDREIYSPFPRGLSPNSEPALSDTCVAARSARLPRPAPREPTLDSSAVRPLGQGPGVARPGLGMTSLRFTSNYIGDEPIFREAQAASPVLSGVPPRMVSRTTRRPICVSWMIHRASCRRRDRPRRAMLASMRSTGCGKDAHQVSASAGSARGRRVWV
jgi:hypothetical protein